tara:strand:- start:50 stop:784 length:735 start_codon:yes stop_codon:yes gene_type:complete
VDYTKEIQNLWNTTSNKDLATILTEIFSLYDEMKSKNMTLPINLELDILLNANYAIGYGSTIPEARNISILLDRITTINLDTAKLKENDITSSNFHRLACTLSSAFINQLCSDIYEKKISSYKIISWFDFNKDSDITNVLHNLIQKLFVSLKIGVLNKWQLELFNHLITLNLLLEDLQNTSDNKIEEQLRSYLNSIDRSSNIWLTWKNEWLEKSDYYRFITLIITNTSHPEERWLEYVSNLIDD